MNLKRFLIIGFMSISLPVYAIILDDMSGELFSPSTSNESSSSISVATTASGYRGSAQEVSYSLSSSGWVAFYLEHKKFSSRIGRGVRFYYRGTTAGNTLEVKFRNADDTSQEPMVAFPNASRTNGWEEKFVLFSDLTPSATNFDRAVFVVSSGVPGSSGTLDIDEIEIYDTQTDGSVLLVDDFNDGADPNFLNGANTDAGNNWIDPGGSGNIVTTYTSAPTLSGSANALVCTATRNSSNKNLVYMLELKDTDVSSYDTLSFFIRTQNGGESFGISLKDSSNNEYIVLLTGVSTSYGEAQIPLSYYSDNNISLTSVSRFQVWFDDNKSGQGVPDDYIPSDTTVVYLEDLRFLFDTVTARTVYKFDDMSIPISVTPWNPGGDANGTSYSLSVIEDGVSGDAYRLNYQLGTGASNYAFIWRDLNLSISNKNAFRFYVNGQASSNDIELKITDSDNTMFRAMLGGAANTGGSWVRKTVPLTDFQSITTGTNSTLDMNNINKIEFALSNSFTGGSGGSGTVIFDEVEAILADFDDIGRSNALISGLTVTPNPFSPNNDGYQDKAEFNFTLTKEAEVKLTILDMSGNMFYMEKSPSVLTAGGHSMFWDGNNWHGRMARNGIFMFQIEATTPDGEHDFQRHVVFVMK